MPLNIRDPHAAELARELASRGRVTMTKAVVSALEDALNQERAGTPLADRFAAIADDLARKRGPNGRAMSKDDVDAMWGH
jgi:antitoxin VapB